MAIREKLNEKRSLGVGIGVGFLVIAAAVIAYTQWPQHRFSGKTTFYSDDGGQTWFIDSVFKSAPFDHDGKQAYRAIIYTNDGGKTKFCAYLMRHKPEDKKRLDDAVAQAAQDGKPASSVPLFQDRGIINAMEIKAPGPGHDWVPGLSPKATDEINASLAPHAEGNGTLDIINAE